MSLLRVTPSKLVYPATTFDEAKDVLNPVPLDFERDPETAEMLYIPHAARMDQDEDAGIFAPGDLIEKRLLSTSFATKVFLSGHTGSGKSSELRRLMARPRILAAFFPIHIKIDDEYLTTLDIAQILYLMACALYAYAKDHGLLGRHAGEWERPLRDLHARVIGAASSQVTEGTTGFEVNVFFFKLKQDLKYNLRLKREFQGLIDSDLTMLRSLLRGLVTDIEATSTDGRTPLLIIDELDKVIEPSSQDDVFRKQPSAFFDLPLRAIYTIPPGVVFNDCPPIIRREIVHLYPAPVLKKAPTVFDPELAVNEVGLHFLQTVLSPRVRPGLFDTDAVRIAAVHSGGVLRSFLRLLRLGIEVAEYNDFDVVNGRAMRLAIKQERLLETMQFRSEHYIRLLEVHRTNRLTDVHIGQYLDQSWVIECFNDKVWYEVNPVLWKAIAPEA